ncbi:DUF1998 domain-containing protein [Roseospira goensis]|uniref:MrfA-like Zn-binding domain-containing protein n=1 Tax=Roseospira goensis TaxID=391922 RepID=A0A7W6S2Z3_9PROT|nr:DUF1998 domain-containing protein [Roseospira goensis]MBB4287232.1 hypothetical protein [Roseospira goensis]
MSRTTQRIGQLITTFGPGAMVDLPTRSVLIGGLDRWEMRDGTFRVIEEDRLAARLEAMLKAAGRLDEARHLSLRTPPLLEDQPGTKAPPGVQVTVFPIWFVVDAEDGGPQDNAEDANRERRRRLVKWGDLDPSGKLKWIDDNGRKRTVTPIRFVGACEKGHLQDIDWRWVVHGQDHCREPLWMVEKGTSADPRDVSIRCDCGRSLSLDQLFAPGRLGPCKGERPWLDTPDPAGCNKALRLLTRTATNAYFAQIATVISLPAASDELAQRVQANLSRLQECDSAAEIGVARKVVPELKAALEGWSNQEVWDEVQRQITQATQNLSRSPKLAEFDVFACGRPHIGEDTRQARLFAETLSRVTWDPDSDPICSGIQALIAVHRLREVSCLYGFTRFEAARTAFDDELEDIQLKVDGAPLSSDLDWLPAVEQFGEGLFFHFDPASVADWLVRTGTQERAARLSAAYRTWALSRDIDPLRLPGVVYTMIHSLSHALMSEIALVCGYPANALKERVYALESLSQPGRFDKCGLLIYTATSGTQGTLGGVVAQHRMIVPIFRRAFERLHVCSNDPICSDHDPGTTLDDRALQGAACHGCLLVSETSCEARNQYLDRAFLVDTLASGGSAFFEHAWQRTTS